MMNGLKIGGIKLSICLHWMKTMRAISIMLTAWDSIRTITVNVVHRLSETTIWLLGLHSIWANRLNATARCFLPENFDITTVYCPRASLTVCLWRLTLLLAAEILLPHLSVSNTGTIFMYTTLCMTVGISALHSRFLRKPSRITAYRQCRLKRINLRKAIRTALGNC